MKVYAIYRKSSPSLLSFTLSRTVSSHHSPVSITPFTVPLLPRPLSSTFSPSKLQCSRIRFQGHVWNTALKMLCQAKGYEAAGPGKMHLRIRQRKYERLFPSGESSRMPLLCVVIAPYFLRVLLYIGIYIETTIWVLVELTAELGSLVRLSLQPFT